MIRSLGTLISLNIIRLLVCVCFVFCVVFGVYFQVSERVGSMAKDMQEPSATQCQNGKVADRYECLRQLLKSTIAQQGFVKMLAFSQKLYQKDQIFASDCHGFMHTLGYDSYEQISKIQIPIPLSASMCGFGFYHGLMELAIKNMKDPSDVRALCNVSHENKAQEDFGISMCLHGVGHGAVSIALQKPDVFGNPQKLTQRSLAICQKIAKTDLDFHECASGVFMQIGNYEGDGEYKLTVNKEDPYSLCKSVADSVKIQCYSQFNGIVAIAANGSLSHVVQYVQSIVDDDFANTAMITAASAVTQIEKKDFSDDISTCRLAQSRIQKSCIQGISVALMLRGNPGSEYKAAVSFCGQHLTHEEQFACLTVIKEQSARMYPQEKYQMVCNTIQNRFDILCQTLHH